MSKKKIIVIISIVFFIVMAIGISYGYFVYNKNVANISLNAGEISLNLSNVNGSASLSNVITKSDYEGINSTDYIDFTVNGTVDTESILYELQLIPKNDNTLDSQYVKVCLTDQQNNVILSPFLYTELANIENNNGKVLYQEIISSNNNEQTSYTKSFRLRIWIDEDYPEVASKTFAFDINIHAYNVDESRYEKVTFNTQDERVGLSKYVVVGEEYGALPTPTREGYTFMGWNGKNLFNEEKLIGGSKDASYTDGHWVVSANNFLTQMNNNSITGFKENTQYTMTIKGYVSNADIWFRMPFKYDGISDSFRYFRFESEDILTYTSTANYTVLNIGCSYNTSRILYISYIQLEEGDTATEYEPYYIENNTTVVQDRNHTLKAVWEKYQKVEYIQSNGNQYIDTQLLTSEGYQVELDGSFTSFSNNKPVLGSWVKGYSYLIVTASSNSDQKINIESGNDDSTYYSLVPYDTNRHIFSIRNSGTYLDNTLLNTNVAYNFPGSNTIAIFGATTSNSHVPTNYRGSFRLYNLLIRNTSGTIKRNYYPCYRESDGEIGLYDTVNNVFYKNEGTGSFIKGPDVTNE